MIQFITFIIFSIFTSSVVGTKMFRKKQNKTIKFNNCVYIQKQNDITYLKFLIDDKEKSKIIEAQVKMALIKDKVRLL